MFGPLLIICALLVFATGVLWIRRNVVKDEDSLITTIDTLLPQTQCAQCGYPGCRPYAQAVAEGAQIDLCPPGGQELVVQLSELMGVEIPAQKLAEPLALLPSSTKPSVLVARCACRPVQWMPSLAPKGLCTPCSAKTAPAANCASHPAQ